ncbi:MAG: hypothetical protein ABIX46_02600, partial [Burkholderiaceae bacterium]
MNPPEPRPAHRRRSLVGGLLRALGVGLALALALGLGALAFWLSDAGPRWALVQVPGLHVGTLTGRPDGGAFGIDRLGWRSGDTQVQVDGLAWRDIGWRWWPYPGAWLQIELVEPRAARVVVRTGAASAARRPAPTDLHLPIEVVVRNLQIGDLQVDTLPAVRDIGADLHLGAESGAQHRVGRLAARVEALRIEGKASLATRGGLALGGAWKLATEPAAALPWQADLTLDGTLARPRVAALLATGSGASAAVDATLAPFDAWPLAALQATTRDLDLAVLSSGLPTTRLTGRAVLGSRARNAPLSAEVTLDNAAPGPWNESRLPLRSLTATLQGRPEDLQTLELPAFALQLGGTEEAGRLTGSGRWQGRALTAELQLDHLRPSRLDARAARMDLSGPLTLALDGLPPPPGAAPPVGDAPPLTVRLETELRGALLQPRRAPVRLAAAASLRSEPAGPLQIGIERLELNAGAARAEFSADIGRDAAQRWRAVTRGEFARFDPAAWWPGAAPAGLARGPNRLDGRWQTDLALPQTAFGAKPAALLQALRGDASLAITPSQLGGLPLVADATLHATDATSRVDAALRVAANRASARLDRSALGNDQWQVTVDAPALAALAPLGRWLPSAAPWLPSAGTLQASAQAQGRWPALQTKGELVLRGARAPEWQVDRAQARWNAVTGRLDAPLELTLDAAGLALGEQRIERLATQLSGSLRQHRVSLDASSPLRLPAWAEGGPADDAAAPRGTALHLAASGAWHPAGGAAGAGAGTWSGRIAELLATPRRAGATPWAQLRDVDLRVRLDPDRGGLLEAAAEPGQAQLLGATLRWREARYAAATSAAPDAPPRIDLVAQLEPVPVVPWLARLQPEFGWAGDLRVGANVELHSAQALQADVVVQRSGGDIAVK